MDKSKTLKTIKSNSKNYSKSKNIIKKFIYNLITTQELINKNKNKGLVKMLVVLNAKEIKNLNVPKEINSEFKLFSNNFIKSNLNNNKVLNFYKNI